MSFKLFILCEELAKRIADLEPNMFQTSDKNAENNFLKELYPQIRAMIITMTNHRTTNVDELANTVLIKIFKAIKKNQYTPGNFTAWIYSIIQNTIIDAFRNNKKRNVKNFSDVEPSWQTGEKEGSVSHSLVDRSNDDDDLDYQNIRRMKSFDRAIEILSSSDYTYDRLKAEFLKIIRDKEMNSEAINLLSRKAERIGFKKLTPYVFVIQAFRKSRSRKDPIEVPINDPNLKSAKTKLNTILQSPPYTTEMKDIKISWDKTRMNSLTYYQVQGLRKRSIEFLKKLDSENKDEEI